MGKTHATLFLIQNHMDPFGLELRIRKTELQIRVEINQIRSSKKNSGSDHLQSLNFSFSEFRDTVCSNMDPVTWICLFRPNGVLDPSFTKTGSDEFGRSQIWNMLISVLCLLPLLEAGPVDLQQQPRGWTDEYIDMVRDAVNKVIFLVVGPLRKITFFEAQKKVQKMLTNKIEGGGVRSNPDTTWWTDLDPGQIQPDPQSW